MTITTKTTRLAATLLLALLGACTAVPDDDASPDAEALDAEALEDDALEAERAGGQRPAADPGPTADPERAQIDELRASLCTQEQHPPPPRDLAARTLAQGLVQPRFRVQEDQAEASLAALDVRAVEEPMHPSPPAVDAVTLEAQARYLAATQALDAEGWEPQERADAKAHEKALAFGEGLAADDLE